MQPAIKPDKYNMIIEKGDEMIRFIEGLDERNRAADAEGLIPIYQVDKSTRNDKEIGDYSTLLVSRSGIDPESPNKFVAVVEYTPVDKNGKIIQESYQTVRHASITLQSKGIARMQEKRGLKLKAAAMGDVKFDFPITSEGTEIDVAGDKIGVKGKVILGGT